MTLIESRWNPKVILSTRVTQYHNRYIPRCDGKKEFSSLHLGRYLLSEIHGNRCLTRGSDGNVLFITTTGHQVGNSPGNHTILESCYNSLNSVKIFMSNLNSLNC